MAKEIVLHKALVHVTVDTETGEVTRVEVDDESVHLADVYNDAAKIAETADWPEWEIGR